jgi:hypothetical protein
MAFSIEVRETIVAGGKSATSRSVVTADGIISKEISVPAAKIGALTTRTDDNTGVLTMNASHGITTGASLDVYWSGGQRLGMTVGTVATNSVPIDGGSGDNLPADETAITAMVPIEEPLLVDGDEVSGIEFYADALGNISLLDDAAAVALTKELGGTTAQDQRSYVWMAARDPVNPIAGDAIEVVRFSHGNSSKTATMRAQLLYA